MRISGRLTVTCSYSLVNSVNIRPRFCSRRPLPKVFCNLSSQRAKSPLNISFYGRSNTILSVRTVHKIGVGLKPDEGDEGSKTEGGLKEYAGSLAILKNVVNALPFGLWLLIVLISYAMAHSERDLYGFIAQALWNKVRWWRKPKILTADWLEISLCGIISTSVLSVRSKLLMHLNVFLPRLGQLGTVFWLAVLLRALSLAIPLTIVVLVWKMFCSLVKIATGRFWYG